MTTVSDETIETAPAEMARPASTREELSSGRTGRRHRSRRRRAATMIVVFVLVTGAASGALATGIVSLPDGSPAAAASTTGAVKTALVSVKKMTLTPTTETDGTLGYSGEYTLINGAQGTYTWLPAVGQVIKIGQTLYKVDGAPVLLLKGSIPAYRDLARNMTGADVKQLNANLVALGYADADDLDPTSDEFDSATEQAVKDLQEALGLEETGKFERGRAIFMPDTVRVVSVPVKLGTQAGPSSTVLTASSTTRSVVVEAEAVEQDQWRKGKKVTVTLADGTETGGVVSAVTPVAADPDDGDNNDQPNGDDDSTAKVDVTIRLTNPKVTGTDDKVSVTVTSVAQTVPDALVVPVTALLALAGGGYAVEVDNGGVRSLVAVEVGTFDDSQGVVQITGTGIADGVRVVVPV